MKRAFGTAEADEDIQIAAPFRRFRMNVGWEFPEGATASPLKEDFEYQVIDFNNFVAEDTIYSGAINSVAFAGLALSALTLLNF